MNTPIPYPRYGQMGKSYFTGSKLKFNDNTEVINIAIKDKTGQIRNTPVVRLTDTKIIVLANPDDARSYIHDEHIEASFANELCGMTLKFVKGHIDKGKVASVKRSQPNET